MGQGLVATPSQLRVAAFPVRHFGPLLGVTGPP
jgi:hypothetical protein